MSDQNCAHEWKASGLWDGKTPEGQRTGGVLHKCTKCGAVAKTDKEMAEKGGTVIEGTTVWGTPLSK